MHIYTDCEHKFSDGYLEFQMCDFPSKEHPGSRGPTGVSGDSSFAEKKAYVENKFQKITQEWIDTIIECMNNISTDLTGIIIDYSLFISGVTRKYKFHSTAQQLSHKCEINFCKCSDPTGRTSSDHSVQTQFDHSVQTKSDPTGRTSSDHSAQTKSDEDIIYLNLDDVTHGHKLTPVSKSRLLLKFKGDLQLGNKITLTGLDEQSKSQGLVSSDKVIPEFELVPFNEHPYLKSTRFQPHDFIIDYDSKKRKLFPRYIQTRSFIPFKFRTFLMCDIVSKPEELKNNLNSGQYTITYNKPSKFTNDYGFDTNRVYDYLESISKLKPDKRKDINLTMLHGRLIFTYEIEKEIQAFSGFRTTGNIPVLDDLGFKFDFLFIHESQTFNDT
jgi:hypothetical protein